jgi:hypothetical protein
MVLLVLEKYFSSRFNLSNKNDKIFKNLLNFTALRIARERSAILIQTAHII